MEYPRRERNRYAGPHATSAHAWRNESVPDNRRNLTRRSNAKSNRGCRRDRDGLRPRSLDEKNLPLGSGGQTQRAVVDPKIAGRTRRTSLATNPLPNCRIRLRHKAKYSAPASAERLRGDRRAGRYIGWRSASSRPRRNFPFQRSGRPRGARLRTQNRARPNGQKTNLRDLSWPSSSRVRFWRIDVQIEIWPSRRESTGQRLAHGQGGDHRAKSRVRRGFGLAFLRG